ncbi:MAG: anthranilate synthase component I [Clostridium sp.]|jgi:anthranilate synthase component 1|nr:anthranilate synthase component I [Clostridium sp.]
MNIQPSFEEIQNLAKDYGAIPISMEILSDTVTPIQVLARLRQSSRHVYLLESAEANKVWGRYSFLGFDPIIEVTAKNAVGRVLSKEGERSFSGDPAEEIRKLLLTHKSPVLSNLPPFTGGLVGHFSYDYIQYAEPTLHFTSDTEKRFRDADFMMFDKVIAFDSYQQKIILIVNLMTNTDELRAAYDQTLQTLEEIKRLILESPFQEAPSFTLQSPLAPIYDQTRYEQMVRKAKDYIKEGEIFQVVLSNRFEAKMEGSLLPAYRILRTTNPSPYMFYFSGDEGEIIGASPETLVKKSGTQVTTFPLAGTRPRGETPEEDACLEADLLADPKEVAEHNMLVDLGRNDLGKICEVGSVTVEKYMNVERFSHVMHLGSCVSGKLAAGKDGLDCIQSVLPAGTLSGAPKIRACEIIDELEQDPRGIYGGAIGYFSFTQDMDFCIAIRLAYAKDGVVTVRSGAGIVADSVPQNEFQEVMNKAKAVKNALESASFT